MYGVETYRTGAANLWHTKWFPWHAAFTAVQIFSFFLTDQRLRIVKNMHIFDCLESVYELPLLPNNNASETFKFKSVAVRSVEWISVISVLAWWWLGECVILDKTFYSILKHEVVTHSVTSKLSSLSHLSRRPLLEI